jgi:DNA-binding transcriptional MerR regulator
MKKHIFFVALLIIIFAVGYWTGKERVSISGKKGVESVTAIPGAGSQRSARQESGLRPGVPSSTEQPVHRQGNNQGGKEARVYNMNDPFERELFAASLKEEGIPEEEIQVILRRPTVGGFPGEEEIPQPPPDDAGKARAYNMNDPSERELFAASLKEQGIPEEEIQEILRRPTVDGFPGEEEIPQPPPPDAVEARAYNMNDPFERELFAATLREKGISEAEIQNVLRQPREDDVSQAAPQPTEQR